MCPRKFSQKAARKKQGIQNLPVKTESRLPQTISATDGYVSNLDPLRRYMQEIRHYSVLEPEEEFRLAKELKENGDIKAAKTLIRANLKLVVKIAYEYNNFYTNMMDLIQEGNLGLMKAVSKFDPTKGVRLGYYSSWWIRSYILKYILDNFRLVKIGTTQAQKKLFYHLIREKERIEAMGINAGPKLLAEKLEVREKDIIEMQNRLTSGGSEISLDTPLSPDDPNSSGYERLADPKISVDSILEQEELLNILKKNLPEFEKNLNKKEKLLLKYRILSENPKTLQELANQFNLTRERIRQIEVQMINKLKKHLRPFLSDFN